MNLRCGVVGLGRGKEFARTFSTIEGCKVIAVCDPNPATFKDCTGLKTYTEYEKFLEEKLDIVAVISPGPCHASQSLAALEQGTNVLCETPCVYSIREAQTIVRTVAKTGLKYMLAENYPWMGWCLALLKMANEGQFGHILYAEGDYTHDCRDLMLADERGFVPYAQRAEHPHARKTWRAINLPPIQYCSHTLGPLLKIMNDRVISAYGLSIMGRAAPDLVPTDLEAAMMETAHGAIIRLTNGFTVGSPMSLYYKLVGTRGSAIMLRAGGTTGQWWSEVPEPQQGWQEFGPDFLNRPDGRSDLEVMLEEFVISVRQDKKPPIDVFESMDMTLPGIIAHQSGLEGGTKLTVPDSRDWLS